MDFLNKAFAQTTELFRSMTPAGRITTGLLLVIIVVSLVFLFKQQTDKADEYLFGAHVLTQSDIAALETAFAKHGLSGWDSLGNRIRVPRTQRHTYLAAAGEEGAIPASANSAYQTLFTQATWSDPRDMRMLKANHALEQFLAQTLRKITGVEDANVKINETEGEGFPKKKQRRAFAAVQMIGNKRLTHEQIQTIRWTVAGGALVDEHDVTVTDLNGIAYPGVNQDANRHSFDNAYASALRDYVNMYQQRISDALTPMYPGVQVAVNVELDKELRHQATSVKYDDKPTLINTKNYTKDSSTTSNSGGGRPGAVSNGVTSNSPAQIAAGDTNESKLNENRDDQESVVGATQTTTHKATLTPEKITASIGIPSSYFLKVWQQTHPPAKGETAKTPTDAELEQIEKQTIRSIQEIVRGVLPQPKKSDDPYEPITVVAYTELPGPAFEEPAFAKTAGAWFAENWQTLGMFGLAAFGVIFLRGMIRASQVVPHREPHSAAEHVADATHQHAEGTGTTSPEPDGEVVASSLKRHFQSSGRSLRDELTDLVREDPDAAANILKLWISDAA
jgi:flagellar M-ring protein FliF